jgi:glycosyltransferase involved in cell wall biosynthesis
MSAISNRQAATQTKNISLLMIVNGEYYAGAERVQDLLLSALPNRGISTTLLILKKGEFAERLICDSASYEIIELSGSPYNALKTLLTRDFDVINCHTPLALLAGKFLKLLITVSRRRTPRYIYHVHSPTLRDTEKRIKNLVKYCVERSCFSLRKDIAVCVSQSVRKSTPYLKNADNVKILCNGVPNSEAYSKIDGHPNFRLVMVALLRPRKGLQVLLAALTEYRQQFGDSIHLDVIGAFVNKDEEDKARSFVERNDLLNTVEFLGECSQIQARLRDYDAIVIPSLYGEGLPMVMLEAMSIGLPIIATRVDGVTDVIEDGVTGILCAPNRPHEIAKSIKKLASNLELRKTISRNARKLQQGRYSADSMSADFASVVSEIVLAKK